MLQDAFKDMNKRMEKDRMRNKRMEEDRMRIVNLEQFLVDAEDMIATLIEAANSQAKEREIAEALVESAREVGARQAEQIGTLQSRIDRKDDEIFRLRSNLKVKMESQRVKYENRLNSADALLRDAYDDLDNKKHEVELLESVNEYLKKDNEDRDKELKLLQSQNNIMKDNLSRLERKVPQLESDSKILKAKYVLQEHLAKVNNHKRKKANVHFNQMKQLLVEKVENLDRHSNLLTTRLEEHLEKQKKEAVQKELLQCQLQDAHEKLEHFQKAARYLETDLNELKEKLQGNGIEKQVIAQVVNKERVKNDLQETHQAKNPSEKVTEILEPDLNVLEKQSMDKCAAVKQVVSLQAKLRFANAKESLLSKALSIKNSDNITQEDRLKEMSEKLASLRSQLCMKHSENELLTAKLQDLEEKVQEESQPESTCGAESSASLGDGDMVKRKGSTNRKVNSLEAELSLLQVPEVIVAGASFIDSWSAEESEKADSFSDHGVNERVVSDEDAELVPEIASEDEEEWDFLSHSTPIEQQELWC